MLMQNHYDGDSGTMGIRFPKPPIHPPPGILVPVYVTNTSQDVKLIQPVQPLRPRLQCAGTLARLCYAGFVFQPIRCILVSDFRYKKIGGGSLTGPVSNGPVHSQSFKCTLSRCDHRQDNEVCVSVKSTSVLDWLFRKMRLLKASKRSGVGE